MRYLIASGYVDIPHGARGAFARLWLNNIMRYANPKPSRIVVTSARGDRLPFMIYPLLDEVRLEGDLGGFMDIVEGRKPHALSGWFGSVLLGAMAAYNDESDLIYLEQDCLAFGPWVQKLYDEIGDAGILFGRKHLSEPWQCCSQSLFLVKHSYILEFVRLIISSPPMKEPGQLGEHKFERFGQENPEKWKMMTFGVDRERPIPYEDPVFYAQQIKPEEIAELTKRQLLDP
jgi:hypothetical protein